MRVGFEAFGADDSVYWYELLYKIAAIESLGSIVLYMNWDFILNLRMHNIMTGVI